MRRISRTFSRVSTLLMPVGLSNSPRSTGKGGLLREKGGGGACLLAHAPPLAAGGKARPAPPERFGFLNPANPPPGAGGARPPQRLVPAVGPVRIERARVRLPDATQEPRRVAKV